MVNAAFAIEDGVARVTLQRPEALNAIDLPTKAAITERMRDFRHDDAVRVVLIEGEGEAFCAGGDLEEVLERDFALQPFTDTWAELFREMRGLGKPVVAKVDGYALGGGFDLMLHADIPIAADEARIGQPEVGLGVVNHFSPPLVHERVGLPTTLDLLLTGELISGARADEIGLVARSVPADDLEAEVEGVLETLAGHSPRVLRKLKDGIYATAEMSPRAGQAHLEDVALEAARTDPDYEEGVRAQREDREPDWTREE